MRKSYFNFYRSLTIINLNINKDFFEKREK